MIKVYQSGERNFTNNGEVVLIPLKAKIYNEDNGDFYLSLDCPIKYADYVKDDNIIVAPTPQGEQPFRIITRTVSNKKIEVRANHVYYDSANFLIADSYVQNKNGDGAIKWLNNATMPTSYFTVSSNVSAVDSYRCVRTSLNPFIEKSLSISSFPSSVSNSQISSLKSMLLLHKISNTLIFSIKRGRFS